MFARSVVASCAALVCSLAVVVTSVSAAGTPRLVKDIYPGSTDSEPRRFTQLGSSLLFVATDPTHGLELWKTDGTRTGTKLVKDINTAGDSNPSSFVRIGSVVYFTATTATHGRELWRTDGTRAGTVMVKDINPGLYSSDPNDLQALGSKLIFYAEDGTHGMEPWRSNGTSSGTKMLIDISGAGDSQWCCFSSNGSIALFSARVGATYELWRTGGTPASTFKLDDLGSDPLSWEALAGSRFFFVKDGASDSLFLYTGSGSPVLLKTIQAIDSLAAIGQNVVFRGKQADTGSELWLSNGTEFGTNILKDIYVGGLSSNPQPWADAINGILFFHADNGTTGMELWKTDGTPNGTQLVEDIRAGSASSSDGSNYRDVVGNRLYFVIDDGVHGLEPWVSDGTAAGTQILKDIVPGSGNSFATDGNPINGVLYFHAKDSFGSELWRTNGTPAGTFRLTDINPGSGDSDPSYATGLGTKVLFQATDGSLGYELWKLTP